MVEVKEKDKGFVKDVEIILKQVSLKVNQNNEEQIDKIIFETDGGNITWKPKHVKESYEGGFHVSKTVPMERSLLPEIVTKLAMASNEKGSVKVKVSYNWWKTEQDGHEVTYRFITSAKTLESWEIIEEGTKSETVLP